MCDQIQYGAGLFEVETAQLGVLDPAASGNPTHFLGELKTGQIGRRADPHRLEVALAETYVGLRSVCGGELDPPFIAGRIVPETAGITALPESPLARCPSGIVTSASEEDILCVRDIPDNHSRLRSGH